MLAGTDASTVPTLAARVVRGLARASAGTSAPRPEATARSDDEIRAAYSSISMPRVGSLGSRRTDRHGYPEMIFTLALKAV